MPDRAQGGASQAPQQDKGDLQPPLYTRTKYTTNGGRMTTNAHDNDLWQRILPELKLQMTQATFNTWLANSTAARSNGTLTVTVATPLAKDWLENRLHSIIQRTATRVAGHPLRIVFTTQPEQHHPPSSPPPLTPGPQDTNIPPDCHFGIQIVNFDPRTKGWVMTSNYAWHFWQPWLGTIPFNLWNTLRSFPAAYHHNGNDAFQWPTIQTLADICANGNRHKILGRAARQGRGPTIGALEVLETERIVWTRAYGTDRNIQYFFRVLDRLPILAPAQIELLTPRLQERHQRQIARCELNYEEWKQLTLPSLLMSGT